MLNRKILPLTIALTVPLLVSVWPARAWGRGRERGAFVFGGKPAQHPSGNLAFDAQGNLYGTASQTVFRFTPSKTGGWTYSALFNFPFPEDGTTAGVVVDTAGNLYGTAGAGANNRGVVFQLVPTSSGQWLENVLYDFGSNAVDGAEPSGGLVFDSQGNLYGTTQAGGAFGFGTVFELTPSLNGQWTESILYSFLGPPSDGAIPLAALTLDGFGNLYSTTVAGGSGDCQRDSVPGCGTVFQLSPSSGGWTENVLHAFVGGSDGQFPVGAVSVDNVGNLYGTTEQGGGLCTGTGCGTVFEITPTAGGSWSENIIHRFSSGEGIEPECSLAFDAAGNILGTTFEGGTNGYGTVFQLMNTSTGQWVETGYYSFSGTRDGAYPVAGVLLDSFGNVYGTTEFGGLALGQEGLGVVFLGKP